MKYKKDDIIGEVVAGDYRTASVFKNAGIDFCCKGNRSIGNACDDKGVSTEKILDDLSTVDQHEGKRPEYKSWPLDLLVDYIEKKHHTYVEEKSQDIRFYLNKICQVHGNSHPELHKIREEFVSTAGELATHMKREELVLFPFIRKLYEARKADKLVSTPPFGSVISPIEVMMQEHGHEGERFQRISMLSNQYTPPQDACNTFKVAYAMLKEFEEDLHLHIHLENNILFPKAIQLEQEQNKEA